jgi:hypothetical protein
MLLAKDILSLILPAKFLKKAFHYLKNKAFYKIFKITIIAGKKYQYPCISILLIV